MPAASVTANSTSDSQSASKIAAQALTATRKVQHSLDLTRDAITSLSKQSESLQRRLNEALAQVEQLESQNRHLQAEHDRLHDEKNELHAEKTALHSEKGQLEAEKAELDAHNQRLHADHQAANAQCVELNTLLEMERHANEVLEEHVRDLHFDLQCDDLPHLALKMAMKLTGAEVGLFTEADGDGALARVGFEDLQEFLIQAIYDYSRRTVQTEAPTVENEPEKLPDGAGLVNLAALPFAIKGELRGVLLLANKRSGPFTDAECRILLAIGQHAGLAMENARLHLQLSEAYVSTVAVLADAIEAKDAYTRGHCEGVSRVAVEVARRLGVKDGALDAIRYAALLHDVGKIGIPDGILLKPGKLMAEEFSIIQKHAAIGRDLVGRVPALKHLGDVILHHHEHFDGNGYPDGLSGEGIPLASRIICVVDAFDAMTTPRPYRDPFNSIEAFEEMRRCSGSHFDPKIVELVTQVLLEDEGNDLRENGIL
jgi:HD-GYP domain-containing protein (c-di-GMP phosphodiesterase class II)